MSVLAGAVLGKGGGEEGPQFADEGFMASGPGGEEQGERRVQKEAAISDRRGVRGVSLQRRVEQHHTRAAGVRERFQGDAVGGTIVVGCQREADVVVAEHVGRGGGERAVVV